MAREIHLQGTTVVSRFSFNKLEREKLYGKKTRLVVDETGNPCSPRSLSIDGSVLVAAGGYAQMYVNSEGETVPSNEIVKVDLEGMGLPVTDSTLNVPQEVQEVSIHRMLDHCTTSPYRLHPEELDPELEEKLKNGKIFETPFAYRKGSTQRPAFLLQNEEGYFLLVSDPHGFEFCAPDQQMVETDSDDPFTDDFDFGMMG